MTASYSQHKVTVNKLDHIYNLLRPFLALCLFPLSPILSVFFRLLLSVCFLFLSFPLPVPLCLPSSVFLPLSLYLPCVSSSVSLLLCLVPTPLSLSNFSASSVCLFFSSPLRVSQFVLCICPSILCLSTSTCPALSSVPHSVSSVSICLSFPSLFSDKD